MHKTSISSTCEHKCAHQNYHLLHYTTPNDTYDNIYDIYLFSIHGLWLGTWERSDGMVSVSMDRWKWKWKWGIYYWFGIYITTNFNAMEIGEATKSKIYYLGRYIRNISQQILYV